MGWSFTYGAKRRDIVREIRAGWNQDGRGNAVLKSCSRGNILWTLNEPFLPDGTKLERWIGCHILTAHDGDWGHKDIEESMGPCYYSCPLEYLELAPAPKVESRDQGGNTWRERVHAYHQERNARRFELGQRVRVRRVRPAWMSGREGQVCAILPRRHQAIVHFPGWGSHRIPVSLLEEVA